MCHLNLYVYYSTIQSVNVDLYEKSKNKKEPDIIIRAYLKYPLKARNTIYRRQLKQIAREIMLQKALITTPD
jgi:hypothetical protein